MNKLTSAMRNTFGSFLGERSNNIKEIPLNNRKTTRLRRTINTKTPTNRQTIRKNKPLTEAEIVHKRLTDIGFLPTRGGKTKSKRKRESKTPKKRKINKKTKKH